jgi:hypothetical protein
VYYFTSNEMDALPLTAQDSRFFVWETTAPPINQQDRDAYFHWLDHENGAAHLMHYFTQELDMGDFDPNEPPPVTDAKRDMTAAGTPELQHICNRLFTDRGTELKPDMAKRHLFTAKDLLHQLDPDSKHRWTQNYLSRCLKKAGFRLTANGSNNARAHGVREYMWALCNHPYCINLTPVGAERLYNGEWPVLHPSYAAGVPKPTEAEVQRATQEAELNAEALKAANRAAAKRATIQ